MITAPDHAGYVYETVYYTLTTQPLPPSVNLTPPGNYLLVSYATWQSPPCTLGGQYAPAINGPAYFGDILYIKLIPLAVSMVDPIADGLESGTGIVSDPVALKAASHMVNGVAADSATQVVLRVSGAQVGDLVQFTVSDEKGPSSDGPGAGYLTSLPTGGSDSRTSGGIINVTAVDSGNGTAIAFAAYHSPSDFVRNGNVTDPTIKLRQVTIQATHTATGASVNQAVSIVRPPVVLVHGIWGSPTDFSGADGGVSGLLKSLFFFDGLRYDNRVSVASTSPIYLTSGKPLESVSGNALGFQFGATTILPQIENEVWAYKLTGLSLATGGAVAGNIAAVQVDVVAHSMGGDITRTLPQIPEYADPSTYRLGYVHKLITIDTPHLGSPLASAVHDPNQNNSCVRGTLAVEGRYSFSSVVASSTSVSVSGATADLVSATASMSTSAALTRMHNSGLISATSLIPTAMIGAQTSTGGVGGSLTGGFWIATLCPTNDLAKQLNPSGWFNLMLGASDGVVPLSNQFDEETAYSSANPSNSKNGVHSFSTENLGFSPPSVLDQKSGVPAQVIRLLQACPNVNRTESAGWMILPYFPESRSEKIAYLAAFARID